MTYVACCIIFNEIKNLRNFENLLRIWKKQRDSTFLSSYPRYSVKKKSMFEGPQTSPLLLISIKLSWRLVRGISGIIMRRNWNIQIQISPLATLAITNVTGMVRDWIWASAVKGQWLTAWTTKVLSNIWKFSLCSRHNIEHSPSPLQWKKKE